MSKIEFSTDDETGDVVMSTPYDVGFVKDFKEVVPYSARRNEDNRGWDEDTELWTFSDEYREVVYNMATDYFGADHRLERLGSLHKRRG